MLNIAIGVIGTLIYQHNKDKVHSIIKQLWSRVEEVLGMDKDDDPKDSGKSNNG